MSALLALQDLVHLEEFERLTDDWTWLATLPMTALAAGVVLLLLADVFSLPRIVRAVVFVGACVVSMAGGYALLTQGGFEFGLVLNESLEVDEATCLWGIVFAAGTLLAWMFSRGYYGREDAPFVHEHDALMLSVPVGMMLMVGANDLIVFFVGLELLSLPLYVLAGFRRARSRSVEAGVKYFLLGSFAAAFFLYGAALLYAGTGTIALPDLRDALAAGDGGALLVVGGALLAASLFFKVSVFPMHLWAPDVYDGAPTPATALMATGAKAAAFGFLVKAMFLLPPAAWSSVAVIAIVTLALGNLGALAQSDVKRMLAWSGVAHAGTVLLVVAAGLNSPNPAGFATDVGVPAALFYMAAYVVTATGAFGVLSLLEDEDGGGLTIDRLRGLGSSRPGLAAALTLFMLSLGGIPATGGFLGKWFVFAALVQAEMIGVAVVGALLSVVALGYYLRVIVAMYMEPAVEGNESPGARRVPAFVAAGLCALGVLLLGLYPALLLDQLT